MIETTSERRFREGLGERYLKTNPNKVRCQGCSKTKLRLLRQKYQDPTLSPDDLWPEAQCEWGALEGAFLCNLHGGATTTIRKRTIEEFMPLDLREKFETFRDNNSELLNRASEIAQFKARNAELYESLDSDLVLGEEAYAAVAEARKLLLKSEIVAAAALLDIALSDRRTEKEVWNEIRSNVTQINAMTTTYLNVLKEFKLMTPLEQMSGFLDGFFRGIQLLVKSHIHDPHDQAEFMRQIGQMIRDLTNVRQGMGLPDGES